jgi:hypothetical protein
MNVNDYENNNKKIEKRRKKNTLARPMAIGEAEQPMPERLYVMMLDGSLYLLTTIAVIEGVGLKSEQLQIKIPISAGRKPVFAKRSSRHADMT